MGEGVVRRLERSEEPWLEAVEEEKEGYAEVKEEVGGWRQGGSGRHGGSGGGGVVEEERKGTGGDAFAFRDSVSEFITRKVPAFPAIEKAVAREGMRLVLLLRLSPVLPDSLMNYCLSLMSIEMSMFVIATAISLVPYTLLYAYLGSISSDIIKTLSGGGDDSGDEESGTAKALRITGIAVSVLFFVGMVWYIGVVIKKAVDDDKDSPGGRKDEEKKDCEEAKPLL
eukprot:gene1475-32860_t